MRPTLVTHGAYPVVPNEEVILTSSKPIDHLLDSGEPNAKHSVH